jgi:hypothetical protein
MLNLLKTLFMTNAEIREAAWDFYVMGNERAARLCIMELHRRDPKGTAALVEEICRF